MTYRKTDRGIFSPFCALKEHVILKDYPMKNIGHIVGTYVFFFLRGFFFCELITDFFEKRSLGRFDTYVLSLSSGLIQCDVSARGFECKIYHMADI